MAKIDLNTVSSGYLSQAALNANFTAIEDEFQNKVLYRDNPSGEPNSMQTHLDMNGFNILNAGNAAEIGLVNADDVSFISSGTGAVSRSVGDKLQDTVSVKDFGAVGDGVTDDTAAIQAAIDYCEANVDGGCIYLPTGKYKVTSTLTVTASKTGFAGAGVGTTLIIPTGNYGDAISFYSGGVNYLQRVFIRDLSLYSASETTSGASVHFTQCRLIHMSNVELAAHFGSLFLESCTHSFFSNVDLKSDANFTSLKTNSYLLKIAQKSGYVIPAELHFVNCDWRGMNGNNYLDYAVLITCADGVWFSNVHWGFCKTAALAMKPETNTTQLTAVNISNCYFDTVQSYGILAIEPSVSYTGVFGAHAISNGQIYNTGSAIAWNCETSNACTFSNFQILKCQTHAVDLLLAKDLSFDQFSIWDINESSTTGYGFNLQASTSYISINNSSVRKKTDNAPSAGINIENGAAEIVIANMIFEGCTYDIGNNSTSPLKDVSNIRSDKEVPTVAGDGSGNLDLEIAYSVFYLNTTNNVGAISSRSAVKGRQVHLIALGAVSVFDSNNLKIAGTFSATADDVLTLICDGTNWHEVGRSVN